MLVLDVRQSAARAVDASLCTSDEFCAGFPALGKSHRAILQHVHQQAQAGLKENAMVSAWPTKAHCVGA